MTVEGLELYGTLPLKDDTIAIATPHFSADHVALRWPEPFSRFTSHVKRELRSQNGAREIS